MRNLFWALVLSFASSSVFVSSAYASEPCSRVRNPRPGISTCYQRVSVEARRVGYGEGISRGRGESTSIAGWFVTGWDVPVSTNSLNGSANLEFIQRGSNFQIASTLDELDRALLNTRDQVQSFANFPIAGVPVTVGGLTEKINEALHESQRRRNALAQAQTNVDRVVITAEASGRCTKNFLGTCVDNQGGWYRGYVDVYMVYVGTPSEITSIQQRTLNEVQQGLRTLEQARGNPAPPLRPPSIPTCMNIDSRSGWQTITVNHAVASIDVTDGGWSVDTRSYGLVRNNGHRDLDAERLAPFNSLKFDQRFPFGALLMNTSETGVVWLDDVANGVAHIPGPDISANTRIQFRINDADNALEDNGGFLRICLSEAVG